MLHVSFQKKSFSSRPKAEVYFVETTKGPRTYCTQPWGKGGFSQMRAQEIAFFLVKVTSFHMEGEREDKKGPKNCVRT